jgi:hypothetical protein
MAIGVTQKGTDGLPAGSVITEGIAAPAALQGGVQTTDSQGNIIAPAAMSRGDGWRATFSAAATGIVPATTAGAIFTLRGSSTKIVRLTRCHVSGLATTAITIAVGLAKWSTAPTGGTAITAPTMVAHDGATTATGLVAGYTVAPTAGTLVGLLRSQKLLLPLSAAAAKGPDIEWEFGIRPAQCPLLTAAITQLFAITISAIPAGGSIDVYIEWTESTT